MSARTARLAVAAGVAAVVVHRRLYTPWQLRWGATDEEVGMAMPGDRLVRKADYLATRAISIEARPEHVWPWLVQIGSGRAGWYSYDRIDNGGVPSARRIVPELQHMEVGDLVPMVAGKEIGPLVKEIDPGRRMLWWDGKGEYTWEWLLEPAGSGTRLVNRLRATRHPWTKRMPYEVLATNGDIVMMRKLMHGIKERAERLATSRGSELRVAS